MASTNWDKIRGEVRKLERAHAKIGVLQSKGGNAERDGITMIELAAIHEFGSPNAGIPERSFLRSTFRVHRRQELLALVTKLAGQVTSGNMTTKRALGILGQWGAAAVKNTIRSKQTIGMTDPGARQELLQSTIDRKGSSTPLIDTGRLINTISYEVVEE